MSHLLIKGYLARLELTNLQAAQLQRPKSWGPAAAGPAAAPVPTPLIARQASADYCELQ